MRRASQGSVFGGSSASLPETVDRATAERYAGSRWDAAAFDAVADDGRVPRDALLQAAKEQVATMRADFVAEEEGELSAKAGAQLVVIHADSDGWTVVRDAQQRTGVVPSEYLAVQTSQAEEKVVQVRMVLR